MGILDDLDGLGYGDLTSEFDAEDALAKLVASSSASAADGEKITFFEKKNTSDSSVEGVASRMTFTGHFAIDGYMLQRDDGTLVEAGLGADFPEAGAPTAAWVWFSLPANEAVRGVFERAFGGTFNDDCLRLDITGQAFMDFADSGSWEAFNGEGMEDDEDDDESILLW